MKRLILVSIYVIASFVMFSCTDDTAEKSANNTAVKVVADDSGEPLQIPPTKP